MWEMWVREMPLRIKALPCISAMSVYLPCISRVSPLYLPLQGFHATVGAMGDMAISTDEARLLLSL